MSDETACPRNRQIIIKTLTGSNVLVHGTCLHPFENGDLQVRADGGEIVAFGSRSGVVSASHSA